VVVSLAAQFLLGFSLALLLKKPFPGRGLYTGCVFYPWALSGFAIGLIWAWMFNGQFGIVNDVLIRSGLIANPIGFLSDPRFAMISVIVANVWYGIPFFAIMLLAALQSVPKELYESAEIDGAGRVRQLFEVTIPYIKPTITSTILLRLIWIMNFPDIIYGMTGGGPANATNILATEMINKILKSYDYGQGAAIGVVIMGLLFVFALIYLHGLHPRRYPYEKCETRCTKRSGNLCQSPSLAPLSAFALAPLYWIFVTSLKSPKEIYTFPLLYWPSSINFGGYRKLLGFANFGKYFTNSLGVSLLASFGSLITSVLAGFALSRFKAVRHTRIVMLLLYFTQMVPSFILMTPLFLTLSQLGLTDNLLALTVVYSAGTMAFGIIMAKSFFDRIPASIEEAALIDGCDPLAALIRIVLPISLPGLVAIFSFSFVNIWNELFLAVILISSDSKMTVPVALNSFIFQG
jgi:multiple sugar transport system permease protein